MMKKEAIKQADARHEKFISLGLNPPPILYVISENEEYHVVLDKYFQDGGKAKVVYSTKDKIELPNDVKFERHNKSMSQEEILKNK
jgi:hypothetical protein